MADPVSEHFQHKRHVLRARRLQVKALLDGDPAVAREVLRDELIEARAAQAALKERLHTDLAFDALVNQSQLAAVPVSAADPAMFALDILKADAHVMQIGLADAVIRVDPPYLRNEIPGELLGVLGSAAQQIRDIPQLITDAKLCIALLDVAVVETGGNDKDGINKKADAQVLLVSAMAENVRHRWLEFTTGNLLGDQLLPTADEVRAKLANVTIRFERQRSAAPEAMRVTLVHGRSRSAVQHVGANPDVFWDGATVPTDLGREFHNALAFDILTASGFDPISAHSLGSGLRKSEASGSFGAVVAEIDEMLRNGRPIELSGDRIADWVNQCAPLMRLENNVRPVLEPLPAINAVDLFEGPRLEL